jgi:hypothetical protein
MKLEAHSKKNSRWILGRCFKKSFNPHKVGVSVLLINYLCYSSWYKSMRGKTHSRGASYSGFYTPEGFFKGREAKNKHKHHVTSHTQGNCRQYLGHTRQSTNNCKNHTRYFKYQRRLILAVVGSSSYETNELILFILGSWLVIVVDSFICLTLTSVEIDGSRWGSRSVVELLTLSSEVQIL